jgi:NAD(P)-dependent dehydrogenase (short-subunit alcohol dehydrogenase family)
MPLFKKKRVLVTGSAKRLGRAIALAFAKSGADLFLHYNTSESQVKELAEEIKKQGGKADCLQANLANIKEAEALFETALSIAPIDILVNNASIFPESSLLDFSTADLEQSLNINSLAPLVLCRSFAKQGRAGVIINLLDTKISCYDKKHVAYHLSKRMLFSLTKMCALEFAPLIRVNAVAPGLVLPPEGLGEEYINTLTKDNPLNKVGNQKQVAEGVLFLCSNDFITGQLLFIDGGQNLKENCYG